MSKYRTTLTLPLPAQLAARAIPALRWVVLRRWVWVGNHPMNKGRPHGTPFLVARIICRLAAVVHAEFDRMRRVLVVVHFFHLQLDIAIDLVLGKDITGCQEVHVALQFFKRFT